MADINLTVRADGTGQVADGQCTFDEGPPTDGAFTSSDPTLATIALAADLVSYHIAYVDLTRSGTVNMTYSGTSLPPDAGPVVMAHNPIVVMCTPAPVAETGDTNPGGAVVS
jgi:hypothetical protein